MTSFQSTCFYWVIRGRWALMTEVLKYLVLTLGIFLRRFSAIVFFRVYGKFKSSNSTTIFGGIPDRYYRSSNASIHKLTSGGNWLQSTPQVHCLKHFYLNRKKKRKKKKMRGHKSIIIFLPQLMRKKFILTELIKKTYPS